MISRYLGRKSDLSTERPDVKPSDCSTYKQFLYVLYGMPWLSYITLLDLSRFALASHGLLDLFWVSSPNFFNLRTCTKYLLEQMAGFIPINRAERYSKPKEFSMTDTLRYLDIWRYLILAAMARHSAGLTSAWHLKKKVNQETIYPQYAVAIGATQWLLVRYVLRWWLAEKNADYSQSL